MALDIVTVPLGKLEVLGFGVSPTKSEEQKRGRHQEMKRTNVPQGANWEDRTHNRGACDRIEPAAPLVMCFLTRRS